MYVKLQAIGLFIQCRELCHNLLCVSATCVLKEDSCPYLQQHSSTGTLDHQKVCSEAIIKGSTTPTLHKVV